MNHARRGQGERFEQFLIAGAERVPAVRVHVQHAAHRAVDHERHGEFGPDMVAQLEITRVLFDIAGARRSALERHPAGDAFAEA